MIARLGNLHSGLRAGFAILAGITTALGFEPFGLWPLALVGPAALTVGVATTRGLRGSCALGWAYGLGFLGLGVGWMRVIFIEAMVALVVAESLFFAVLGALLHAVLRTRWWPILAAGCWSLVEFAYSRFPFDGFGWMRLGFAMVDSPFAGFYPFVGVTGVSFLTALTAQGLAWLALAPSRQRSVVTAGAIGAVAFAGFGAGTYLPEPTADTVEVGYVQGGAPGGGVYGLGEARTITRNHLAETRRLEQRIADGQVPQPDFVVWPENSTDLDPFHDTETGDLVASALSTLGRPILVGTITDGPGTDERQTSSLWWHPSLGVQARYDKRGIVPFGEYVPLRDLLLPLIPNLRYVGAQSVAGTTPGVLPVTLDDGRGLGVGVMVCYDVAFDHIAYDTVTHGAQVLLVQSSNAMYQGTGQIEQQFAITRVRAAELRRDILVVTTSGVSGLIRADGSVAFSVPDYTSASGVISLPLRDGLTPATWLAPALDPGLAAATLAGVALVLGHGRRIARRRVPAPGAAQ